MWLTIKKLFNKTRTRMGNTAEATAVATTTNDDVQVISKEEIQNIEKFNVSDEILNKASKNAALLDKADSIPVDTEYHKFVAEGESARGTYVGNMKITVKSKKEKDKYEVRSAAVWMDSKRSMKMNAGAGLLKSIADSGAQPGDAIEIIYKGKEDTNSGQEVNTFKINRLDLIQDVEVEG